MVVHGNIVRLVWVLCKICSKVFFRIQFQGGGKSTFLEIEGGIKSKISGVKLFSGGARLFSGGGGKMPP